ncbi:MAG: APC family permease [Gulosibacter sp.]|uniref:APC family permease n=1 Tax=Gulosibacter sp. TaxID=2817531 RepID=UPI003F8F9AE4
MTNNKQSTAVEESASQETGRYALRGRMGTVGLLFTVLAFTAPMGVVYGFTPVNISFGIGAPLIYVLVAILMMLFAVGFMAMSRAVPRPGAFYTYIREGLGRPLGLGASFLALGTYGFNVTSAMLVVGISVKSLEMSFGFESVLPWWVYSAVVMVATGVLSYFNVELSAKVLSIVLVVEVLFVVIVDIVVLSNGGPEGLSPEPWNPANIFTPALGVVLLFSIGVFNGFEATAIYRDEVKEPSKTIPRATYLAIAFLGIFYAITAFTLITGHGVSSAVQAASEGPDAMMPAIVLEHLPLFMSQLGAILTVTSFFASILALQNIITRYTHSLAVDGIFPRGLAKVHKVHGSPHRSATFVAVVLIAVLAVLSITAGAGDPPYAAAGGVAFYGMILLLFLTGVSVIVYFRRNPEKSTSRVKTFVFPLIALLGIGFALVVATMNMHLLMEVPTWLLITLILLVWAFVVGGFIYALALKRRGSPAYQRIGRAID